MNTRANSGESKEMSWIKSYMDLTGVTESQARSVYMHVGCRETLKEEGDPSPANGYSESYQFVALPTGYTGSLSGEAAPSGAAIQPPSSLRDDSPETGPEPAQTISLPSSTL